MIQKYSRFLFTVIWISVLPISNYAQSGPPYSITWINETGVSVNGSILTKTASTTTWTTGAVSSNILAPGINGWLEFVAVNGHDYIVGFSTNNLFGSTGFTHSIFINDNNHTATVLEGGASGISLGAFQTGDIFRIAREGGSINYYKNGIVVRTVSSSASAELKVKGVLSVTGKSTPQITTSFDCRLILYGVVTGLNGDTGTGSISISASGGQAPYTYTWSSGELTNTINNKPQGDYTVTVSDALGRVEARTYSVGYKINWINQVGVTNNNGRLTKTAQDESWASGAISSNLLPANTNGWIEFVGVNGHYFRVGLAVNNIVNYTQFSNSLLIDHNTGSGTAVEGETKVSLGNFQTGDVFRISREGNLIKYHKNGIVLRTVAVSASLELKIKASLHYTGTITPYINTSFDSKLIINANVIGLDGNSGSGSIALNASGGEAPYSYTWSSGEQSNTIANKPRGDYTVTVSDAVGRVETRTYSIGYKIDWVNQVGVSNNSGRLTKTAQVESWASGAISSNLLPANADGWIEFVGINGHNFRVGLAVNNIINYTQFSNSLLINHNTGSGIAVEGQTSIPLGNLQTGDVFRISREGNLIKYYRNGIVLRTIAASPSMELKVKTSLYYNGTSTPYINTSFDSRLIVNASVVGLEGNSGSGSIALSINGGTPPYDISWSSGENTSTIDNKPRGTYTAIVNDALGRVETRTYSIGYKVNWTNLVGVSNINGRLSKTAVDELWTSGGVSLNILPANTDGWIEFVGVNGHNFRLGLAVNNVINYTQFTSSFLIDHNTGSGTAVEGQTKSSLGNFQTGDVFRISREGYFIKYYKNGIVVRTISLSPSLVLKVKACLLVTHIATPHVNTSFWQSDGIVRTYYTVADGNWTNPSIWSLSENGPPSTVYPDDIDKVVIKGHEVTVNSNIKSAGITIRSINDNTRLKVEGNMAALEVNGNIVMNRDNNSNNAEALLVQNNGKLDVK